MKLNKAKVKANTKMDYSTERFTIITDTARRYINFNLKSGDGTLNNGLFEFFPDGKWHLHIEISSTDTNDDWELKFTFVAQAGYEIQVILAGEGDPHLDFPMPESNKVYTKDLTPDVSPTGDPYDAVTSDTYKNAFYLDISYSC